MIPPEPSDTPAMDFIPPASENKLRSFFYGKCPQQLLSYWDKVESSAVGSRLAGGAFWALTGAVASRGLLLFASLFLARILGRDVYGEFGMIRTTVNMFLVFAGFGLGMTATKHVAECRSSDPVRAGRIMGISGLFALGTGIVVAGGLYIFAPWVATHTINAPTLAGELQIGAFILLLNAVNGAQTGALAGFEAFKSMASVNLWTGVASFVLLIGGAYLGELRGAVCALGVTTAINWLLNHLALRREAARHNVPFTIKGCLSEWRVLWRFSLPAALSGMMISPVLWACSAMLVNQRDGYGQMGMLDVANQWRMAILFIPGVVGQIVLPMLSHHNGLDDHLQYQKTLKYSALINGTVALAVALPVAVLSPMIMETYGPDFKEGALAMALLTISTVLVALNNIVGQVILSKGQMWFGLLFNFLLAMVLLLLSQYFIHRGYGVLGFAIANLIAYICHTIWQSIYLYNILCRPECPL